MPDFVIRKGDTAPPLEGELLDENLQPIDLSRVYDIRFEMTCNACDISGQCEVVDEDSAHVRYQWQPGDTDIARRYEGVFIIEYRDGRKLTVPTDDTITVKVK